MKYKPILHLLILIPFIQTPSIQAMKRSFESYDNDTYDNNNDLPNLFYIDILYPKPEFQQTEIPNQHVTTNDIPRQNFNEIWLNPPSAPINLSRELILNCPIKYCSVTFDSEHTLPDHMRACHTHIYNLIKQEGYNGSTPNPPICINTNNNPIYPPAQIPALLAPPSAMANQPINTNNINALPAHPQEQLWVYYECPNCPTQMNYPWEFVNHNMQAHKISYALRARLQSFLKSCPQDADVAKKLIANDQENHKKALELFSMLSTVKNMTCPYQNCTSTKPYTQYIHIRKHIAATHLYLRYVCQICKTAISQEPDFLNHLGKNHAIQTTSSSNYLRWQGIQDLKKTTTQDE